MTLRYAALAAPTIRIAYEEAMSKARNRLALTIAPAGKPIVSNRIEWLREEMLKTRVAQGIAPDSWPPRPALTPTSASSAQLRHHHRVHPRAPAQLTDITALHDDAAERGWDTEVAGHARVITSIQNHLNRVTQQAKIDTTS